ncbi:MAG TPA: DUF6644 family protein [Terriglobia bacterium]|nr:DUF6644 family protein [Terriglobia bacterium]
MITVVEWCKALEDTRIGEIVRESAFPYVEGAHVLGLALSVGTVVWFDLRLLGATMRTRPVEEVFRNLKGWMIAGFSLMFLSGALLFTAHAAKAYANNYFRAKIALIVLAGVNTAVYHVTIDRRRSEWSDAAVPPVGARAAGLVSLVLWFSVIAAGRIFAYDL